MPTTTITTIRASQPMTVPTKTASPDLDEYADVAAMFTLLHTQPDRFTQAVRQRELIVHRCLPLADHVARRYSGRGEDVDDLVQVARMGLVKAVNGFDPTKGSHFVAYAVPTIMGEVRRHFRDHGWAMHVPRKLKDRHGTLTTAARELTQSLGHAPTATQLAAHLDLSRDDVLDSLLAAQAYRLHSLDAPIGGREATPQMVTDTVGKVDDAFDRITDQHTVRPLLAALPQRERTILYLRFFESMTQSQIAQRMGISQMRQVANKVKGRHPFGVPPLTANLPRSRVRLS